MPEKNRPPLTVNPEGSDVVRKYASSIPISFSPAIAAIIVAEKIRIDARAEREFRLADVEAALAGTDFAAARHEAGDAPVAGSCDVSA